MNELFILQTPEFSKWVKKNRLSESAAKLRAEIAANPNAGDVIPGSNGLRKIRMSVPGRGKRGGARAIYVLVIRYNIAGLILGYRKNDREDLTPEQLAKAMKIAAVIETNAKDFQPPQEPTNENQEDKNEA